MLDAQHFQKLLAFANPRRKRKVRSQYADVYSRAVASAVDLALLFALLNWLFQYINTRIFATLDPTYLQQLQHAPNAAAMLSLAWNSNFFTLWVTNAVIQFFIIGIFYVSVQILWGTTPGKWVMGLKVVRNGTHARLSSWRYILRFFAYVVACAPLMLGIIWASFNPKRRGWHDYIAGTVVLDTRPNGWYWGQLKKLYFRLRGRSVAPVEQPVGEPAAEQSNQHSGHPIE